MYKINFKKILATLLLSLVLVTCSYNLTEISYPITCNCSINDSDESKIDPFIRH